DAVLTEMEQYAAAHTIPIVGPAMGRVLQQLALMVGAKTVCELGSAIGYSTIWWAQAVGDKGRVIYTDGDRKNADRARGYFSRAGVANRITVHTGDALEFLSEQKEQFDIIFNEGDRKNADRARGYFSRAGVANRITVHTGDALEFLSEQKEQFDIIFN